VKYKAFEFTDKDGPWKENITKQIYDIEEIEPVRLSAKSHLSVKVGAVHLACFLDVFL
jgi:hypothetical protein